MLEKIHIQNFKAHANTPITFSPITIFIGPNNTGKSSIFQIIQLLKQSDQLSQTELCPRDDPKPGIGYEYLEEHGQETQRTLYDLDDDRLINIGNYEDIVRNSYIPIRCEIVGSIFQKNIIASKDLMEYHFLFDYSFKDNRLKDFEFSLDGDNMQSGSSPNYILENQNNMFRVDTADPDVDFNIRSIPHLGDPIHVSSYGFKNNISRTEMDRIEGRGEIFSHTFQAFLKSCIFIYGIRGFEKKYYDLIEEPFLGIELASMHLRNMATISAMPHNRLLEEQINEFFKELLNIEIKYELYKAKYVEIKAYNIGYKKDTSLINEGLGVQQLYSILIPIAMANEHDTVFLEEPENHLHPEGQSKLVEVLLKAKQIKNLQYIISTHSEHILLNFLLNIKRKNIKNTDIKIYSFTLDEEGASVVTELTIDENGQLEEGIPGFFDASLKIIQEMLFQD